MQSGAASVPRSVAADLPTMGVPIRPVTPDDVVTIGVAIEVPDPHGPELQRWRADFGDPLADAIPAHVTLLPPTVVPPSMTERRADDASRDVEQPGCGDGGEDHGCILGAIGRRGTAMAPTQRTRM